MGFFMTNVDLEKVYQKINDIIGDDCTELSKCKRFHDLLNEEKNAIEFKLLAIQDKIPAKIEEIVAEIDHLRKNIDNLTKELDDFLQIYETGDVENAFEKLTIFAKKKQEYDKRLNYLNTLKFIASTSSEIKKWYFENNWNRCISLYVSLSSLLHLVYSSHCTNLLKYLKDVVQHWHTMLKTKLITEYEQLLKQINWPFVVRNKSTFCYPPEDLMPKFQELTKLLLQVELPKEIRVKPIITSSLIIDFPPPSLPVYLLLEPLRKRFIYHFCGNRQTNRLDKPEWMFSQVLTWIKDHELFLEEWMQPVYETFTNSVKVEFISGLMKTVTEKLDTDLMHLQYDDNYFTHTLDETLSFYRELTVNYGYPVSCPSVLSVFTQAQIFVKWINIERKCAEKRMDDMLNNKTAWTVIRENEKCKVTECGNKFIILLSSITDRYASLPQPGHRLQFLDLQLDLIDDFRLRLVQLERDNFLDVLTSDLPGILNTVHYISTVLFEWETDTHFLMLHHFKYQNNIDENSDSISVFSDILSLMNHFSEELTKSICSSVMLEISAKSRPYRKDRWNTMPPMDPDTDLGLTLSGCAMFQALSSKLHQMRTVLASEIFAVGWRYIANQLCKLIIDDVILVNMFSKGGAQQIKFDVTRNILPLFAQFTSKPEAYFKPLIEACNLLCLDATVNADSLPFPISSLNKSQVEAVLNRKSGRMLFTAYN